MSPILYGIPNCDTVKKARTWLERRGVDYVFHDFKKAGITSDLVNQWLKYVAWDVLVNRKGTTWRGLADDHKATIVDAESATSLMVAFPSVVKRPVLFIGDTAHVGFSDTLYQQIFNTHS